MDYISIISLAISLLAFYISLKEFKVNKITNINEELFEKYLLINVPKVFNEFLENPDSKDKARDFIDMVFELKNKIRFYQLYNVKIYHDLISIIIDIDDNFENYCQERNSRYVSNISQDVRKLYQTIYNLSLILIIYYDIAYCLIQLKCHFKKKK